jgi:hypothetical protein
MSLDSASSSISCPQPRGLHTRPDLRLDSTTSSLLARLLTAGRFCKYLSIATARPNLVTCYIAVVTGQRLLSHQITPRTKRRNFLKEYRYPLTAPLRHSMGRCRTYNGPSGRLSTSAAVNNANEVIKLEPQFHSFATRRSPATPGAYVQPHSQVDSPEYAQESPTLSESYVNMSQSRMWPWTVL